MNRTLVSQVNRKICQDKINIPTYIYNITWPGGDWYYGHVVTTAKNRISQGTNSSMMESECSGYSEDEEYRLSIPIGAIVGAAVGGIVLIAAIIIVGFAVHNKQKYRGVVDMGGDSNPPGIESGTYDSVAPVTSQNISVTPFVVPRPSDAPRYSGSAQTSASGHNKPGSVSPSPPIRAEIYQTRPLDSSGKGSWSHIPERHEDSEALTGVFGLGRSTSGRLPPSYQTRDLWNES
ncbi:unnamed protein product [Rhizoctonia solani]|uniref:Uncharacterized protein n=1 Tax=Rhizoctonia solani TaxID=456999 RepID=A0A8H2XW85_9AGAM|nr:unnamed protein product [Rhizoctonia solani]